MEKTKRFSYYVALFTAISAILTFGIAFFTTPVSGPFCRESCIEYPFTDILNRFPHDNIWMYPALLLILFFVMLTASVHHRSNTDQRIFSQIALSFAIISSSILFTDYFLQLSVIQPALLKGETDGISILTQYNPHGVFTALEEAGYIMMSLCFLFLVPALSQKNKIEKAIRWVFLLSFISMVVALIWISLVMGIHREYIFEVTIITINYVTLAITGILFSLLYNR